MEMRAADVDTATQWVEALLERVAALKWPLVEEEVEKEPAPSQGLSAVFKAKATVSWFPALA